MQEKSSINWAARKLTRWGQIGWGRIGLSSVLRPCQHSIGYMGDGFYRSKDPTNSIKVLKEQEDGVGTDQLGIWSGNRGGGEWMRIKVVLHSTEPNNTNICHFRWVIIAWELMLTKMLFTLT